MKVNGKKPSRRFLKQVEEFLAKTKAEQEEREKLCPRHLWRMTWEGDEYCQNCNKTKLDSDEK